VVTFVAVVSGGGPLTWDFEGVRADGAMPDLLAILRIPGVAVRRQLTPDEDVRRLARRTGWLAVAVREAGL
jgi:hypothetical protein